MHSPNSESVGSEPSRLSVQVNGVNVPMNSEGHADLVFQPDANGKLVLVLPSGGEVEGVSGDVRKNVDTLIEPLKREELEQCLIREFRYARLVPRHARDSAVVVLRKAMNAAEADIPRLIATLPAIITDWSQISHCIPSLLDTIMAALPQGAELTKVFSNRRDPTDILRLGDLHEATSNIAAFLGKHFPVWVDRQSFSEEVIRSKNLYGMPPDVKSALIIYLRRHKGEAKLYDEAQHFRICYQSLCEIVFPNIVDKELVEWMFQKRKKAEADFFNVLENIHFDRKHQILTSITAQHTAGYDVYRKALNTPSLPTTEYKERILAEQGQSVFGNFTSPVDTKFVPAGPKVKKSDEGVSHQEAISGPSVTKAEFVEMCERVKKKYPRSLKGDPRLKQKVEYFLLNVIADAITHCPSLITPENYGDLSSLILEPVKVNEFFEGTTFTHAQQRQIMGNPMVQPASKIETINTASDAVFTSLRRECTDIVRELQNRLRLPMMDSEDFVKFFAQSPLYLSSGTFIEGDEANAALFSTFVRNVLDNLPKRLDYVMAAKIYGVIERTHVAYLDAISNLPQVECDSLKKQYAQKAESDLESITLFFTTAEYREVLPDAEEETLTSSPYTQDILQRAVESEQLPAGFEGNTILNQEDLYRLVDIMVTDFLSGDLALNPRLTKAEREQGVHPKDFRPVMSRFKEIARTVIAGLNVDALYTAKDMYQKMLGTLRIAAPRLLEFELRPNQLPNRLIEVLGSRLCALEKASRPKREVTPLPVEKKSEVVAPKATDDSKSSDADVIVENPLQGALDLVLMPAQRTPEMIERVLTEAVIVCFDRQMPAFEASASNGGVKKANTLLHTALRLAMKGLCDDGIPDFSIVKNQVLRVRGLLDLSSAGLSTIDRDLFFKIVVQAAIASIDAMQDPLELLDSVMDMDLTKLSEPTEEGDEKTSSIDDHEISAVASAFVREPLTREGLIAEIRRSIERTELAEGIPHSIGLKPEIERLLLRYPTKKKQIQAAYDGLTDLAFDLVDNVMEITTAEDLKTFCKYVYRCTDQVLRSNEYGQNRILRTFLSHERDRIGAWIRERLGFTAEEAGEEQEEDTSPTRDRKSTADVAGDPSAFNQLIESWFGVDLPEARKALARGVKADLSRNLHALLELLPKRNPSVASSVASKLSVTLKAFLNGVENEMSAHANPDHIAVAEMLEAHVSTLIANLRGQVTEVDLSMIAEAMEDEVYRFAEIKTDEDFLLHSSSVGVHALPDVAAMTLLLSDSRPVTVEPEPEVTLSSVVTSLVASEDDSIDTDVAGEASRVDHSGQTDDMSGSTPSPIESREIAPEIEREYKSMINFWWRAFAGNIRNSVGWLLVTVLKNCASEVQDEGIFRKTVRVCVQKYGQKNPPTLNEYARIRSDFIAEAVQESDVSHEIVPTLPEFVPVAEATQEDPRLRLEYNEFKKLHAIVRRDRRKNIGWFIVSLAKNVYGAMSSVPARSEFSALMEESFGMVIPYSFEGYCRRRGMPPMEKAEAVSEESRVLTAPETVSESLSAMTEASADLHDEEATDRPEGIPSGIHTISLLDDIRLSGIEVEEAHRAEEISAHTPATTTPVVTDVILPSPVPPMVEQSASDSTLHALRTETARKLPPDFGEVPVEGHILAERLSIGLRMHRALSDALAGEQKNMTDLLPKARHLVTDALGLENELQQFLQGAFGNCMAQLEGEAFEKVVQDCVLDVALAGTVSMKEVDRNALADRIRQDGLEPIERMKALLKRFRQYEERVEELSVRSQTLLASARSSFGVSEQMNRPYFGITASALFASDVTSFGVTVDEMRRLLLVDSKRIQHAMNESIRRADIDRINKIVEDEQSLTKALRKLVPEQRAESASVDTLIAGDVDASAHRQRYSPEEAAERLSELSPLQINALRILTGLPEKRETTHGYAIKRLQKYWKVVFPDLTVPEEVEFARAFAMAQDAPSEGNPLVADCRELNGQDLRSIPGRKNAANILRRQGDSLLKVWQPYPWKPVDFYLPSFEAYDVLESAERGLEETQIAALREVVNQDSENLKQILLRKKKKKDSAKKKV